jgi:aminopeptidase N
MIFLSDYRPSPWIIQHVDLDFQIFEDHTQVQSQLKITSSNPQDSLVLNAEDMEVKSVSINGASIDFVHQDDLLTLSNLPSAPFILSITNHIDPSKNTALEGLYISNGMYCTQCEAEGFRRITPFLDRPDMLCTWRVRVEADVQSCPVLLSNGNLIESGHTENNRHFTLWVDSTPKGAHLFALVAGDFQYIQDYFTTRSNKIVDLRIYVRAQDIASCDFAMQSLKHAMKWDEDRYGREYQYDRFNIVAVSDFNMGGMENTSLNIFNTACILALPETTTDAGYYQIEATVSHEYFHNWSGNRVGCRDWFQISLKEGFTVFREQHFCGDMSLQSEQRILDIKRLRTFQFPEDSSGNAHAVQPDAYQTIDNFYTLTVYEKGAELIRMMYILLGADTFRAACDVYFDRYDGKAVTCDDFVACMAEIGKIDLTHFKQWYKQIGTPIVESTGFYDAAAQRYTLTLTQKPPVNKPDNAPLYIPIKTALFAADGTILCPEQTLILDQATQDYMFENIPQAPTLSLLRNFSAPVILKDHLTLSDYLILLQHDNDGFNQWEMGQKIMTSCIDNLLKNPDAVLDAQVINAVQALLKKAITKDSDCALIALSLTPPDYATLEQNYSPVNPAALDSARRSFMHQIATACEADLGSLYHHLDSQKQPLYNATQKAYRALKNCVLGYLSTLNKADIVKIAYTQYQTAQNMTDRMGAFSALSRYQGTERAAILDDLYNRFKHDDLVIDKWFNIQAASPVETIFEDLKRLESHPDFNIKNPNRCRSLYSAFGMLNPVAFHDPDGRGYDFLTQAVLKIDPLNPQMAARIITPLTYWQRMNATHQAMMKDQLQKILSTPNLSKNIQEIVGNALKP